MTSQSENLAALTSRIAELEVKLSRTRTSGGLETQAWYGPEHAPRDYAESLGNPGKYPFTRGAYPEMYRSRMWTLRNIVGYGAPEDTREGIERTLRGGGTGINVVVDALTQHGVDPDHPALSAEAGLEGCSLPCVADIERLVAGIDLSKVDIAWHWAILGYPMIAAAAIRKGVPLNLLQGSHMPDHLQMTLCGWGHEVMPPILGHRTAVDCLEFCIRNSPRWSLGIPQAYDLRERGLSPAGEIAVGMAMINRTVEDLIARGLSIDEIAPSLAWVSTSDIDFFEEIAKFRALRRVWARTMKERFSARSPRSMRLRIACHTSGRSLVYKQPLNNLTRVAIESLAALLGGVQALEACTFDEPLCVPTPEARELATRTQQILANEVGAARTADPLGGSYYVEALTDEVEAAALSMLKKIEETGFIEAVSSGLIERWMDEHNLRIEKELANRERVVIGLNELVPENESTPKRFKFDPRNTCIHLERFQAMKGSRDQALLGRRLGELFRVVRDGQNATQATIDALLADGSIGEVWGTIRLASGHPYDPFRVLESPFGKYGVS